MLNEIEFLVSEILAEKQAKEEGWPQPMVGCPGLADLLDTALGRADTETAVRVNKHCATCSACDRKLSPHRRAKRFPDPVRAGRRALLALAASLLLAVTGLSGYWLGRDHPPGEVLPASTALTGGPRGSAGDGPAAAVVRGDVRVYHALGKTDITVGSPRAGFATIVVLAPDVRKLYYLEPLGGRPYRVEPSRPANVGPVQLPGRPVAVLVVVTPTLCSNVVEAALPTGGVALEEIDVVTNRLKEALWKSGQPWIALDRFVITPEPVQ